MASVVASLPFTFFFSGGCSDDYLLQPQLTFSGGNKVCNAQKNRMQLKGICFNNCWKKLQRRY